MSRTGSGKRLKSGDAGASKSVSEAQAGEGEPLHRIAGKHGEAGAVLVVILDELRIDADRLALQERQLPS